MPTAFCINCKFQRETRFNDEDLIWCSKQNTPMYVDDVCKKYEGEN